MASPKMLDYCHHCTSGWVNDFLFLLLTIILFSLAFTYKVLLAEMSSRRFWWGGSLWGWIL